MTTAFHTLDSLPTSFTWNAFPTVRKEFPHMLTTCWLHFLHYVILAPVLSEKVGVLLSPLVIFVPGRTYCVAGRLTVIRSALAILLMLTFLLSSSSELNITMNSRSPIATKREREIEVFYLCCLMLVIRRPSVALDMV